MSNFSKCKNFNDVFAELMETTKWPPIARAANDADRPRFILVGSNEGKIELVRLIYENYDYSAEKEQYDTLTIYKQWEIIK